MTDSATLGDYSTPAPAPEEKPISGELWSKVTKKKPGLGDPRPFFGNMHETNWESFTVTLKGNRLLKMIENYSGNIPGSGALMTFKDSSWLMSLVVAAQPHFRAQDVNTTIFWGYGLYTDQLGDSQFQPRKMTDRPAVVPEGSTNFAMISQFVEIPEDMVFTEEYSVRAARIAVYTLMEITKPICPVTPYVRDPRVLKKALETTYR